MKLPALSKPRGALKRARARFKAYQQANRISRIGLVIDATASRNATWNEAQEIQRRMFSALSAKSIALRLMHFGANELSDLGWQENASTVAAHMASVRCQSGLTRFTWALPRFPSDDAPTCASAVIVIGDAFEEDFEYLAQIAKDMAAKHIKVFSFLEWNDPEAERAFKALAEITGGAFASFGDELPLADLCEGVALLTGGKQDQIENQTVKRLLLSGPQS